MASIPRTSTYDVFLSFRGKDTRCNFTDHLYNALVRRGIRTFRDDKLRRGEEIAPELLKVIEESTYSVIVFSENYAHSRWCLDELVKIMECKKDRGNTVIPIFYHVDPSHVRKQEGSFGDAFAGYKENWKDKIPRWRMALTEAGNLSGWHLQDGYESNKIKEITDIIFRRLKCKRLDVGANLVGIDSRVKEMILWLHMESSDVRIVGIYGVGGIEIGIKNLNDKCLITLPYNRIAMHDLIQQMGWKIVREKFPDEPNKWSRLWDPCDFERALTANEGIKRVETISLDLSKSKGVCVSSNVFAKTTRLRLLKVHSGFHRDIVREEENGYYDDVIAHASKMQLDRGFKFPSFELRYLCWDGYPLDFLPSNFDGGKLVELHLHCSNIKRLWLGNKDLERLKVIDLSYSRKLIQMSEFSRMPNLESLFLNGCVSLIDIHPSVGNLKKLTTLSLRSCDKLKNLPDSIWDLESLWILDLSYCLKFEKFPGKGGNMKSLRKLHLKGTAIKDLPDSIGDLESLLLLDLSDCSKLEKFPEKGGKMKSLEELDLKNTAIKDLPDSIGDLESLEILDLSDCSKFEKFPEKGGNMKCLRDLCLRNSDIKYLFNSVAYLKSLSLLNCPYCSNFEKFPEKGGGLHLKITAIKDLPTNISRLKNLKRLILGGCSDLWEGLISNQLCNLQKLNISQCKMAGQILVLPSSLQEIDAYHCTSKEDLSGLLWLCHLNWLKSTTEELKCWKLGAVIPESNGIPEWIRYQNMGSEVTTELPTNWYEDPDFLGFVVSCVPGHIPDHCYLVLDCELNLHGNGFEFKDDCRFRSGFEPHGNFKDLRDHVWVWWYPKIAIPKEHHHKYTHINASFNYISFSLVNIKKCGINLIFAGDQQNHMPMLEHPQNSGDNGSALQDTDGNVHGANQDDEHYHIPTLDLLGNVGDNGSVVLEDTKTVREDVMINSITSINQNEITCGSCWWSLCFFLSTYWWKPQDNEEK